MTVLCLIMRQRELFEMHAERDMETLVKHDQRNTIKNDRSLKVEGSQTTQIDKGRTETITGNDTKTVLAGNNLEIISLLKSTQAKDIFQYAQERIELEVGEQTSITMDNEKILLRFGKSTILMNGEGIWLDGVHIGLQEKDRNLSEIFDETFVLLNHVTDEKISDYPFFLIKENGEMLFGRTDENGQLPKIITGINAEKVQLYFGDEALYQNAKLNGGEE